MINTELLGNIVVKTFVPDSYKIHQISSFSYFTNWNSSVSVLDKLILTVHLAWWKTGFMQSQSIGHFPRYDVTNQKSDGKSQIRDGQQSCFAMAKASGETRSKAKKRKKEPSVNL